MSGEGEPACASKCRQLLLDMIKGTMAEGAHVTHLPPLVVPVYDPLNVTCPHGVTWYMEPTGEQIMQWAADGVS